MILAVAVSGRGLVDPGEPVVHVDDEAFMRGRGAFETMRVYGGSVFRFAQHLERLAGSCVRLGIEPPSPGAVNELFELALAHADARDAMLRVYATPGRGDGPVAIAVVAELPADLDELRGRGLSVIAVEFRPSDLIGGVKSTSYALNMMAVDAAHARGADDAVFVDAGGTVLEATTSNVWWRADGKLYTPAVNTGILDGVTRGVLAVLAPAVGYDVREGSFALDELASADEAFTSSSVREVMPVVELDGRQIGEGRPGTAAAELQVALREQACR